jgi:hypothetical protein
MRLFHISKSNLNGKTLSPTVPNNMFTKLGIEDNKIPRVSFAPTIDYALLAIGYNRLKEGPKELKVFEPDNYKVLKIMTPEELTRKRLVPDADKTQEYWVLNNVRVKYTGKIKLIKPASKFVEIDIGQGNKIKNYFWEYKIVDGDFE